MPQKLTPKHSVFGKVEEENTGVKMIMGKRKGYVDAKGGAARRRRRREERQRNVKRKIRLH